MKTSIKRRIRKPAINHTAESIQTVRMQQSRRERRCGLTKSCAARWFRSRRCESRRRSLDCCDCCCCCCCCCYSHSSLCSEMLKQQQDARLIGQEETLNFKIRPSTQRSHIALQKKKSKSQVGSNPRNVRNKHARE